MKLFNGKKPQEETLDEKRAKIDLAKTNFAVREAYKALRTNVMFSLPKKDCRRIIVTSAVAGDGKSTNAINLAITLAETGTKVLLVDCDLRRPNVANFMNIAGKKGLSNVLTGYCSFDEAVVKGVEPNLDILPSGEVPPNPTELLGSSAFSELLDSAAEKYEYIILDTSPVNLVTDTVLLSKLVDGIIIVVRANRTEKDSVNDAVNSLRLVDAKILGFIFNAAEADGKGGFGKYGKYGSYSYGSYGG